MLFDFARALNDSDFSRWIRLTPFVVQGLQTIHILALAAVLGSAFLLDLRLLGWVRSDDTAAHLARRFMPGHWTGFIVLLLSGVLLIAGEPIELIFSDTLRIKLALAAIVIALTCVAARLLRVDARVHELPRGRRTLLAVIGGVSLVLFVLISFAGRFVAYT